MKINKRVGAVIGVLFFGACLLVSPSLAFADIDDDQNAKIKAIEGKLSKQNSTALKRAVKDLKARLNSLEKQSNSSVEVVSANQGAALSNEQIARVKVLDLKLAKVTKAKAGIDKAIAAGLDKSLVAGKRKELLAQETSIKKEKAAVISGEEKASDAPDVPAVAISFEYDFVVAYDDHGFDKAEGVTPTKTTELGIAGADLVFAGTLKKVSYSLGFDLSGTAVTGATVTTAEDGSVSGETSTANAAMLDHALVSRGFGSMITLSLGLGWANEGGYDNKNLEEVSLYTQNHLVFPMGPLVQVGADFGKGGNLTLQLMNDVQLSYNTAAKQPALIVEWVGSYGPVSPLIQYVPYDGMNHSKQVVVGLGLDFGLFSGTFDYIMDDRVAKVGDEAKTTSYTSIIANMSFSIGDWAPHVKFSTMDVKQPDTDAKGNADAGTFDDNGQTTSVGVTYGGFGDEFAPYLSIDGTTAKVVDGDSTETKTGQVLVLGCVGAI